MNKKKRNLKQGATSDVSSKKRLSHTLQVKEATVALKRAKLNDKDSDYASTPEDNDPNGPYLSLDHESSEESNNEDSE